MIPALKLPHKVHIQAKTITYNDIRMPVESWDTVAAINADIQPIGGEIAEREYGIVEQGITLRMFCNYSSAVQLSRRVLFNGRAYEIRYIAAYRNHIEALLRVVE